MSDFPGTRSAPPRADAMLESLRGLGYSTASALADIIDNSISAGAANVSVTFAWEGPDSRIAILDDGSGMSDAELESAMRVGDKSPLDARGANDLGRFGMGLKTASFSQCSRLTVASKKAAERSCLRWDLRSLKDNPTRWLMFEGPASGSEQLIEPLDAMFSGTLVLWEDLDRIVTAGYAVDDFNDLMDVVETHLAMVFHRLIAGPRPVFRIRLNGKQIEPWDPFMTNHPAKPWHSPVEPTMSPEGLIAVECHVLPHKDKLTEKEFKEGGGPEGWTAQQGFYVYRNKRLLVPGGWLGLGQGKGWHSEESHRLARIRLDIPNTADAAWKIDIRKSTARIPVGLRPWLTAFAEDTRARARKVFAYRGAPAPGAGGAPVEQAWRVERSSTGLRYRIDEKHPAVAGVLESAGALFPNVKAMLSVIQETVPVQRIWLDTAENRETPRTGFAGEPPEAVTAALQVVYADMTGRRGMSVQSAKRALRSTEPFQNFPELIDALGAND
jgi:hypothetical protein